MFQSLHETKQAIMNITELNYAIMDMNMDLTYIQTDHPRISKKKL